MVFFFDGIFMVLWISYFNNAMPTRMLRCISFGLINGHDGIIEFMKHHEPLKMILFFLWCFVCEFSV